MQLHHHRSEHWIVVEGIARVTIESNVKILKEGQSIYVPVGSIHRLQNNAKIPLIVIIMSERGKRCVIEMVKIKYNQAQAY